MTPESDGDMSLSDADRATFEEFIELVRRGACINEASAKAHAETAAHYERVYSLLGIGIIVLTAMTSASLLQAIGQSSAGWQKIVAAVLSAMATALAAVQTFLKAADKAKAHDHTAREYTTVSGDQMGLLFHLELIPTDKHRVTEALENKFAQSDQRRRAIEAVAPMMPRRYRDMYEKQLKPEALEKAATGV